MIFLYPIIMKNIFKLILLAITTLLISCTRSDAQVKNPKFQKKLHKKYVHENDAENASLFRNKSDQEFLTNLETTIIENINKPASLII